MIMYDRFGWGSLFSLLPYGDVWRASRRMFTKYFNPSNPSINQPREVQWKLAFDSEPGRSRFPKLKFRQFFHPIMNYDGLGEQ